MTDKPFQPYDVIHTETGRKVSIMSHEESQMPLAPGWSVVDTPPDGFRERRKRSRSDMRQLMKDGIVADPNAPQPHKTYGDHVHVIEVPVHRVSGAGTEE